MPPTAPRGQGPPPAGPARGVPAVVLSDPLHRDLVGRLTGAVYAARSGTAGEWLYVSPQIETILGFAPQEFLDDAGLWARQLHPDDAPRVLAREDQLENGTDERDYDEYRMLTRSGRVVWVLDDVALVPDPVHGTLQHGLLFDITRRKRTELLLAEHAQLVERVARGDDLLGTLRALAQSTREATCARSCVVVVEPDVEGLGGLAVDERGVLAEKVPLVGRPIPFLGPDGARLGQILLDAAEVDCDPAAGDDPSQDAVGWATRLAAMAVGRAWQHTRTQTSFSLLEATLESTADGILVVDASGRIAGYNQKFARMWQIPEDLMASRDDDRLLASVLDQLSDPHAFVAEVGRLYESPEQSSYDVLEFRDGRVFERYSQPQRLDGRSVGRVWSFRDMTSYRELETELRRQAHTDPLTGLPNRHLFMERVETALATGRDDGSVALLLLDVDDFKTVNDSLGHVAGDMLLVSVAERLSTCVRAGDTAGRLGGDEFVVLLDDLGSPAQATALADRILAAFVEPVGVGGRSFTVRASIGIAVADRGLTPGELVRNADLAMYTAKRDGGAQHRTFAAGMHSEAMARLDLKADLAHAVGRGGLTLHYQPMVRLDGERVQAFEALVRWQHPRRGLVPPAEFIPLAEETGLIDSIGRWVLETACADAAGWVRGGPDGAGPSVSVNLSPRQLSNPRLCADIQAALDGSGLSPARLCLELTESALAQPHVDVAAVLRGVRTLGVGLALDDFGTGYSSLGMLGVYPLDVVKVDKSFVARFVDDAGSRAIVEAILRLAGALGLDVVAEGVETEAQRSLLARLGCPKAQGYLFARPAPAAEILSALSAGPRGVAS